VGKAATQIGIPLNDDYNGETQEGVGYFQQTAHKGFRWSTARGFLNPARKRDKTRRGEGSEGSCVICGCNRLSTNPTALWYWRSITARESWRASIA